MAQSPDVNQIKQAIASTQKKIRNKRSKQKAQGKDFVIDEHSGGVIPESVWKSHKETKQ